MARSLILQIRPIKKWEYRPSNRELVEKVDEIVTKLNILIGDNNYKDENDF